MKGGAATRTGSVRRTDRVSLPATSASVFAPIMAQSALRVLTLLAIASAAFAQCTDGTAFIPATADGTYDKVVRDPEHVKH